MKKIAKIFAAVMLVAVAAVGAFAAAQKSAALIPVYYINSLDQCVQAKVEAICPNVGTPDCVKPLFDAVTEAPLGLTEQIFASKNQSSQECEQAYRP